MIITDFAPALPSGSRVGCGLRPGMDRSRKLTLPRRAVCVGSPVIQPSLGLPTLPPAFRACAQGTKRNERRVGLMSAFPDEPGPDTGLTPVRFPRDAYASRWNRRPKSALRFIVLGPTGCSGRACGERGRRLRSGGLGLPGEPRADAHGLTVPIPSVPAGIAGLPGEPRADAHGLTVPIPSVPAGIAGLLPP